MSTYSQLLLPPKNLASCIAGCIFRDTREASLSAEDRVNYFPASPLYTVTLILKGQLHIADGITDLADLKHLAPAPRRLFQAPRIAPHMSWSPGPIVAMTIAFYPDAWLKLKGTLEGAPPEDIASILSILEAEPISDAWPAFCAEMARKWNDCSENRHLADWAGSSHLRDWTYYLLIQIMHSGPGRSMRSAQRRLQQWSGFNRKELEFYSKVEGVHRIITAKPDANPAEIAADAGFSDQSHMGRAIKRATGFSPTKLNQKIAIEEPFWCYRLLGERF